MSIWFKPYRVEEICALSQGNMIGYLGIEFTAIGEDWLEATMPVDERTRQPFGVLHGGASVVLAETLGSMAANLVIDRSRYGCVGLEINANHLRPAREGRVRGVTRPVHLGKRTHVWEIRIFDRADRPVCISRHTVAVLNIEEQQPDI